VGRDGTGGRQLTELCLPPDIVLARYGLTLDDALEATFDGPGEVRRGPAVLSNEDRRRGHVAYALCTAGREHTHLFAHRMCWCCLAGLWWRG